MLSSECAMYNMNHGQRMRFFYRGLEDFCVFPCVTAALVEGKSVPRQLRWKFGIVRKMKYVRKRRVNWRVRSLNGLDHTYLHIERSTNRCLHDLRSYMYQSLLVELLLFFCRDCDEWNVK